MNIYFVLNEYGEICAWTESKRIFLLYKKYHKMYDDRRFQYKVLKSAEETDIEFELDKDIEIQESVYYQCEAQDYTLILTNDEFGEFDNLLFEYKEKIEEQLTVFFKLIKLLRIDENQIILPALIKDFIAFGYSLDISDLSCRNLFIQYLREME